MLLQESVRMPKVFTSFSNLCRSSLDLAQDLSLLKAGLEPAVAHLRGCVNEFELNLLQS